MLSRRSKEST
ncbi:hypothetical protein F383_19320 [Gossypium arboreum]|uniref:Uncharacterized protein n=1 Tax=Gossypium arboreum TaxID=29729 RepID=A0A0B0NNZ9_GOSAR|nr:hypothetical protein F383_19320 [Gossypium arboreum]